LAQFESTVNKKPAQTNDERTSFSTTKETYCYQYECEHVNKCWQTVAYKTEDIWECIIQTYIKTTNIDKIGLIWRAIEQIHKRSKKKADYAYQDLESIYNNLTRFEAFPHEGNSRIEVKR
jgi:hypothetical protein